jgi:hypothetical protein
MDPETAALVRELKAEISQLSVRVLELEKKLEEEHSRRKSAEAPAAVMTKIPGNELGTETGKGGRPTPEPAAAFAQADREPVTAGTAKGTFRIPGTETSLGFGGYVKLDTIYNSSSALSPNSFTDQIYFAGLIPLRGQGEPSQLTFNPRETRFWFKSYTPTSWGELATYLELDFYAFQSPGDQRISNSYAPRLRHAFGSLGGLVVGQTWTTFMNVAALPELLDFGAPAGRIFVRQPLVRWTQPFRLGNGEADWQIAFEQPESALLAPDGERLAVDDDRFPDTVLRLDWQRPWGTLSAAGMVRQIRYAAGESASERWGAAIGVGGRIRLFERDTFSFHSSYGNAVGRYTSFDAFEDGFLDASGRVHLRTVFAGFAAFQHGWNAHWRSTVAYGYGEAWGADFGPDALNDRIQSAHVNLLWSPFLQTTFGLEYMYATRTTRGSDSGELQRVLFSGKFNF